MPADYEGPVQATLIHSPTSELSLRAVLYLHGYIDYFFQDHLAAEFNRHDYHFYALELRKYGRSLLPGQHPNYCRSLREYYPDLTEALELIRQDGAQEIILLGHSTGGLLGALYLDDGPLRCLVSRLVLNSPFLEFNTSSLKRHLLIPLSGWLSLGFPYASKRNEISPFYARSIHCKFKGEWGFDLQLKPIDGIPLYFAWLRAVRQGQRRVKRGLQVQCPVLVMSSTRSAWPQEWKSEVFITDTVLNVSHIAKYAPRIATDLTYLTIRFGMHDLFLSQKAARTETFEMMFSWLRATAPCVR